MVRNWIFVIPVVLKGIDIEYQVDRAYAGAEQPANEL